MDSVLERIETLANTQTIEEGIKNACLLVEREARINAQAISDTGNGEGLAGSIASEVKGLEGVIYTPLFYAPYVEYGTGIHAEGGKGRQDVPWVFVKGSGKEGEGAQKSYSLDEAKKAMALLREKGLDAYYTFGQHPQPFMRPALDDNRDKIIEILKGGLIKK
jgi:HK97 gp10 family phage protein